MRTAVQSLIDDYYVGLPDRTDGPEQNDASQYSYNDYSFLNLSAESSCPVAGVETASAENFNPDIGPQVDSQSDFSVPTMTQAEFCEISASVAITSLVDAPPGFYTLAGVRMGSLVLAEVGLALDAIGEFLSASDAAQDIAGKALDALCNMSLDVVDAVMENPSGAIPTANSTDEPTDSESEAHGADGGRGSQDAKEIETESSDGGESALDDWSWGGGNFSGGGATGGWDFDYQDGTDSSGDAGADTGSDHGSDNGGWSDSFDYGDHGTDDYTREPRSDDKDDSSNDDRRPQSDQSSDSGYQQDSGDG